MSNCGRSIVTLAWVMACLVAAASGKAPDDPRTIALTDELSNASAAIVTPSQKLAERKNAWTTHGLPPTLTVAGHDVILKGGPTHFGVDMNGDGNVSIKESITKGGREGLPFKIRIADGPNGEKRYLGIYLMGSHRVGKHYAGEVSPLSCKKATIDGQIVRIYDDNMDGQFTTDGKDAIAIGRSAKAAVPFYSSQRFGKTFYDVTIESDGSALTLTLVETSSATVELATKTRSLRAFVVSDGTRAYDLTQVSEILPGRYKLLYGLAESSKDYPILIVPSDMAVTYDVQADKINQLQVVEPLWIWYSGGMNGRKLSIHHTKIIGAGGEHFLVSYLRNTAPAKVTVFKGRKVFMSGVAQSVAGSSGSFGGEANVDIPHDAEVLITTTVKNLGKAEIRVSVDTFASGSCPVMVADEPVIYDVKY
jgi:hypothetical protein